MAGWILFILRWCMWNRIWLCAKLGVIMAIFSYIFQCLLWYLREECGDVVIFGTAIRYHKLLMLVKYHLALCHIWEIMATFSYILCTCTILEKNGLILFIHLFGTLIRYHMLLMGVKQHLATCQIWVIMAIFFLNYICLLQYLRKE